MSASFRCLPSYAPPSLRYHLWYIHMIHSLYEDTPWHLHYVLEWMCTSSTTSVSSTRNHLPFRRQPTKTITNFISYKIHERERERETIRERTYMLISPQSQFIARANIRTCHRQTMQSTNTILHNYLIVNGGEIRVCKTSTYGFILQ